MIALLLILVPVALYLACRLLAQTPPVAPPEPPQGPYSWGNDEQLYRWLVAHTGLDGTLAQIRALDTTEEPTW